MVLYLMTLDLKQCLTSLWKVLFVLYPEVNEDCIIISWKFDILFIHIRHFSHSIICYTVLFAEVGGATLDSHHGFVVEYGKDRDVDLGKISD